MPLLAHLGIPTSYCNDLLATPIIQLASSIRACTGCRRAISAHRRVQGMVYCPIRDPDVSQWLATRQAKRQNPDKCTRCGTLRDASHRRPDDRVKVFFCPQTDGGEYGTYDNWHKKVGSRLVQMCLAKVRRACSNSSPGASSSSPQQPHEQQPHPASSPATAPQVHPAALLNSHPASSSPRQTAH